MIVAIHAPISFDDWLQIGGVLRDLIEGQGNLDVVLDLNEVVYLEHAAAPLIVHAARQARDHGGRLRVADRACADRCRGSGGNQRRSILDTEFDRHLDRPPA